MTDTDDPPAKPPAPADPFGQFRAGVETFRGAMKWAISGAAAIGALLVASVPLANLGAVEGRDRPAVALGVALIVGGILAIIGSGLRIMRTKAVFAGDLPDRDDVRGRRLPWRRSALLNGDAAFVRLVGRDLDDLVGPAHAKRDRPIHSLRESRKATVSRLKRTQQLSGTRDQNVANLEKTITQQNHKLTHLAWIARLEHAGATFRQSALITLASVAVIAAGMWLMLDGLHDPSAGDKAEAEVAKLQAETDKLAAETRKINAETDLIGGDPEDDDTEEDDTEEDDTDTVLQVGHLTLEIGDITIGAGALARECETGDSGRAFLESAASYLLREAGIDAIPLLSEADKAKLAAWLAQRTEDLPVIGTASDILERLFGRGEDPAVEICSDWPATIGDIVNEWVNDADLTAEGAEVVNDFLIGDLEQSLGAVLEAATTASSVASTVVIVDNSNFGGMD